MADIFDFDDLPELPDISGIPNRHDRLLETGEIVERLVSRTEKIANLGDGADSHKIRFLIDTVNQLARMLKCVIDDQRIDEVLRIKGKTEDEMRESLKPDDPEGDLAAMLADSTHMIVAGYRASAGRLDVDDETIAAMVRDAIKNALEGDGPFVLEDDLGDGPGKTPTMAGVFHETLVRCGVDRSNQREQERWFAVVEKALADALAS
ncbi:hypothetical protein [Singulisphaera acidiphila]|uniref:Uncharacterized protein n=1 Tax=Singulisphaera acidiphila (strain ATCC BAA-1392 / DSM 18658 / VKM B-2454 / MOB10) TaxID=886293 RepID=L0DQE2_SINAD|nr:hypothetical protein [Singulisphaera acidiphila]AGA31644.1 hypothetical protein Sinac_7613 [Singulisphaera acidiphila DSM 18658]